MMDRKLVNVRVNPDIIESWLKSTGDECVFHSVDGVPSDAKMIDLRYNFREGIYYALFTHDSFDPVAMGNEIPVMTPTVTVYYV